MEKIRPKSVAKSIVYIPLLLLAAFTIAGFVLIELTFKKTAIDHYKEDLTRLAKTGVNMLQQMDRHVSTFDLDLLADTIAEGQGIRVTIIDISGEVLGDSRLSKETLHQTENHGDRPEIIQAGETGIGISSRFSRTLNIDLLYVAVPYSTYGREGFFRVALALNDLEQDLLTHRLVFAAFGIILLTVFSFISLLTSRHTLSQVRSGKALLEKQVEKRTRQIEMLQNIGTQLTVCNTIDEGLDVIQQGARVLLPRLTGALALMHASKDRLVIARTWNGRWPGIDQYTPDKCWSLRTGQRYFGDPNTEKIPCDHYSGQGEKMLCLPIFAQGETYGALHFSSDRHIEWTKEEIQLTASIAEHASLTLANLELRESLRHQAIRDPLTNLYNRRYLVETFENELSRAGRRNYPMSILMIDLDHFKGFNDTYGHEAGDFILKEFGELLRSILRDEDTPCRYGGEEFTVLLPETDRIAASLVAEKIRKTTRDHEFTSTNQNFPAVTLSIGVAVFPENGTTKTALFKKADEALYKAKEGGRDQVVVAREDSLIK